MKRKPERRLLAVCLLLVAMLAACDERPSDAADVADAAPGAEPAATSAAADTLDLPATNYYEIRTPQGRMVVRLYDETPLHRDNFKRLVATQFYDSTLFHRIVRGFMIQGGDPNSLDADPFNDGRGDPGYTLPAEFNPRLVHKRGALAAARQGDRVNPERRSSGSQFYLVQGRVYPDSILTLVEQNIRQQLPDPAFAFADSVRARYVSEGGAPELDGMYTVFGELVEGFDVLDRVAGVPTPRAMGQQAHPALVDRPLEPVWMIVRPLPEYAGATTDG